MKNILRLGMLVLCMAGIHAQIIDMVLVDARDEFHWGVSAYHNGFFDKAVLSLEKSFSLKPDNAVTRFWLGEAYRRLGFEETALRIWGDLEEAGMADAILVNKIDLLNYKRGLGRELSRSGKYVSSYTVRGRFPEFLIFERPAAISILEDGSYFISSFTTNEVLHLDANGAVRERLQGGIVGLDHPYGVAAWNGKWLFVSEYKQDRIVRMDFLGKDITRFGSSGRGDGQLSGPQAMSIDEAGYLYVTEIGNRRVSKFDQEGQFLFSFGRRSNFFPGFRSPSGILTVAGKVYVSDSRDACIHVFDSNGNFLYTAGKGYLISPEGMSLYTPESIIIADVDRIVQFDMESRKFSVLSQLKEENIRIVDTALDANRNLLAVDFNGSKIDFFTEVNEFYSGLVVEVMGVRSELFPAVQIIVDVSNRLGEPFTGLKASNFIVTEAGMGIGEFDLVADGQAEEHSVYSLVIEKSPASLKSYTEFREAVDTLAGAFGPSVRGNIVKAGSGAVAYRDSHRNQASLLHAVADEEDVSQRWDIDGSLFLAANQIVDQFGRKAVYLVTTGVLPEKAFDTHSLIQVGNYLKNNRITLYVVYTQIHEKYPEELEYLVEQSGGASGYLYRSEGIDPMVQSFLSKRNGFYVLEYESPSETDFGERYLELDVEVSMFSRSGRDRKGYFAPFH